MITIELNLRHKSIVAIVKQRGPITSEHIAMSLGLTRSAIRPELSMLTMAGILIAKPRVGYVYNHAYKDNAVRDKLEETTVKSVSAVPIVIDENASIYEGIVLMFLENVGSLIVLSEGALAGMLSRKDIIKAVMGQMDIHTVPIGVIMTRMPNIFVAYEDEPITVAAKRLIDHSVDCLPVVENCDAGEKACVIGRLSKTTIAQLFVELTEA